MDKIYGYIEWLIPPPIYKLKEPGGPTHAIDFVKSSCDDTSHHFTSPLKVTNESMKLHNELSSPHGGRQRSQEPGDFMCQEAFNMLQLFVVMTHCH